MENNKKLYTFIGIIGVAVILFSVLKVTDIYDISVLFGNDEPEVIDVWESEPFGEYDVTVKLESYTDGKIFQFIQCDNSDLGINYDHWIYDPAEGYSFDTRKYEDCAFATCAEDEENGVYYFAFAVPKDTDYMMVDGNRIDPVVGTMNTAGGMADFKLCCLSLNSRDVDIETVGILFVDEEGNEHIPITE